MDSTLFVLMNLSRTARRAAAFGGLDPWQVHQHEQLASMRSRPPSAQPERIAPQICRPPAV